MGDHNAGTAFHQPGNCFLDPLLGFCVNIRSGFIQNQDDRIIRQRAGKGQQLALAGGKRRTAFCDRGSIAVGKPADKTRRVYLAGGGLDRFLMLVTDTFVVIPSLPVMILMTSLMKGRATVIMMALVLALFAWAWPSRQIRSMALSMKERDFIHTAWFSGEGTVQTVVTEILPFTLTWSLSNFMNATLSAIASESGLAVLGLSPANLITLGNMIQWARNYNAIIMGRWNWILPPILSTIILFVGLFMLITGYNDYTAMKRGR